MAKILIIDNDLKLVEKYDEFFRDEKSIEIVGKTYNGKEAIEFIESNTDFDLIILELVLPIIDGFEVLDYLEEHNIKKKVIITSSFKSKEVIKKIYDYDVEYFLFKPFNLNRVKNVIQGFKSFNKYDVMVNLKNKLHDLGMPSSILGYYYVRDAIVMVYDNPKYIRNITKVLYPEISLRYDTTSQRVERLIRHAIEVSWLRGNMDVMDDIFGNSVDINKGKPTNSEFIITLAEILRLENDTSIDW